MIIMNVERWISAILTALTFAKLSAFLTNVVTFTIFFLAASFLAFATLFDLIELNSQFESSVDLLSNFIKSLWISC